jgi:uncharacterized protein
VVLGEVVLPTVEEAQSWYSNSDPVHGFPHVQRVLNAAENLGKILGADLEIVRAAVLLHDACDAHPGESDERSSHEVAAADFANEVLEAEGWPPERIEAVQHCIRSHRYRSIEEPETLEAKILFDADKLDVVGAFGVARTVGYAVQAGQPIYSPPSQAFLDTGQVVEGEPHSAYHEFWFKLRHVPEAMKTKPGRRLAEKRARIMRAFFDELAVEASGEDMQSDL